jgi:membrane fusion protein, multidrug efflux system
MKFLGRLLLGVVLLSFTGAVLTFGVKRFIDAREELAERKPRPPAEREQVVNAHPLRAVVTRPQLLVYGEIRSWRTVELRAPAAGRLVQVDPRFRDGSRVLANADLVSIDPADSEARKTDAAAVVSEADAEVAEAREAVGAAEQELNAAERQRALRQQSLERQRALLSKGYATRADIEAAELSLAGAEQSVLNRAQMVITARKRVERADLKHARANITLSDADRDVGDTRVTAPFAGTLTAVDATLGRLVAVNEKLGELIDPTALEVVFRVSNRQFSHLLDESGQLQPLPLKARLQLGSREILATGTIDRVDAVVGSGQSGRRLFGRLDASAKVVLRPGDFVAVSVTEAPLKNVAVVPSTAVGADGSVLVIGNDGRLSELKVTIARRQGDELVLANVPFGQQIVAQRLPQLSEGVRVRVHGGAVSVAEMKPQSKTIELEPARRDQLIQIIAASKRLPEERKQAILEMLSRPQVPRRLVERIEARIRQARGS